MTVPGLHSRNDGHLFAAPGDPQYPDLLAGYKASPHWKVAGVDYRVGLKDSSTLTDWRELKGLGITVNAATGMVRVDRTPATLIANVDFALGGGAVLSFVGSPTGMVKNCRFARGGLVQGFANMIAADAGSPGLGVFYCEIDGGAPGYTNGSTLVSVLGGGLVVVEYCRLKNSPQHALELTGKGIDLYYSFNLIENIGNNGRAGNHPNVLQWEYPDGTKAAVCGNTVVQRKGIAAGEGFQFYPISGAVDNIDCSGNVLLAPGSARGEAASYLVHGAGPLAKNASYRDNFFDTSGAWGAFYPGSVPAAQGGGNIDMVTGAAIVPAAA